MGAQGADDGLDEVRAALARLQGMLSSRKAYQRLNDAAGIDLTQQAALVLEAVVEADGASPARIAKLARMDPGAVSRQLRVLETAGLVERVDAVEPKSLVQIRPTAAARPMVRKMQQARARHLAAALSSWDHDERGALGRLLTRLVDDLSNTPVTRPRRTRAANPGGPHA